MITKSELQSRLFAAEKRAEKLANDNRQLRAALESARSLIAEDRQTLFDCHRSPITGRVDDELGAEALATYDRHLSSIDAALQPAKNGD